MTKDSESYNQQLSRAYVEIDSFMDKFGETFYDAVQEEDNYTYEMAKSIIKVFGKCNSNDELRIAESMLIAICGYSIETLINRIRERDKQGFVWESC